MSEYNYNEKYFETIDNEHKAYWLGFLYADGYVEPIYRKDKIKAFRIEIGLSIEDKHHLELLLQDIESDVPISERNQKIGNKTYSTCRVRINNTKMCRDLINLGCTTRKSLTLEFPSENIVPKEYLKDFIRGYFDGDGCISYSERDYVDKRNNKQYTQKNIVSSFIGTHDFLSDLSEILSDNDINFSFNKKPNCGKASEIRLTKHSDILNLYRYIYNDATIFLSRKKEKFINAFDKLNIQIPASYL